MEPVAKKRVVDRSLTNFITNIINTNMENSDDIMKNGNSGIQ